MVDFVEEVEEQLRSDRYRGFARRAWPWLLAALIAVVVGWVGAWGYNSWRDRNIGRASTAYDQAVTDLVQGDQTGAFTAFDAIGKSGPAGYRSLALMQEGGIRLAAGKTKEAVEFFDSAARAAPNAIFGDLARLRAVQALIDSAPYSQIEPRLKALMGDRKPFDLEAREAMAMAKLVAGKTSEARGDFNALTITLGVTPSMRARAQAAIALIELRAIGRLGSGGEDRRRITAAAAAEYGRGGRDRRPIQRCTAGARRSGQLPERPGRKRSMNKASALGVLTLAATLALGGCSTISKVGSISPFHKKGSTRKIEGVRIPIIAPNDQLAVSDTLKGQDFFLPPPAPQTDWPLPGATPAQSVENVDAAPNFSIVWRKSFGIPSSRRHHVTAPPISAGGRIFVMDGVAMVSAHDARTGATVWRTNIMPKSKRDHEAWGGGLAFDNGRIFVSSGFREVVALDAASGALVWRSRTDAPVHAAPTVFGGRVFVADVEDELFAFDAATGAQEWTYQALTEPARILAASSPAVDNETVVTSFASGELVAVRAANGNELWNASLSRANRTNALSEIRDIPGRPVIYKNDVYAVSHSDVFAAVDLRTGSTRWTLPVSAISTPWPAGDVVYVVDQKGQVICASRDSGQVYWIRDLNQGVKPKKRAYWSSPLMASSRLITLSSKGEAVAINAKSGAIERRLRLGADVLIGPIAVNGMVYVVTDSAQLLAIR